MTSGKLRSEKQPCKMSVLASFNQRTRVISNPLIFDISIEPGENSQPMKNYDSIRY